MKLCYFVIDYFNLDYQLSLIYNYKSYLSTNTWYLIIGHWLFESVSQIFIFMKKRVFSILF